MIAIGKKKPPRELTGPPRPFEEPVLHWLSESSYHVMLQQEPGKRHELEDAVAEWKRHRRNCYFPPSMNYGSSD